jgi:predicted esterase
VRRAWAMGAGAAAAACSIACARTPRSGAAAGAGDDAGSATPASVVVAPDAPSAEPLPTPPPAARRVRHDSVPVKVVAGPGDDWVMHESAPLVEPSTAARPVTVLLHALCADDHWTCDWLQYFAMAPQWQLCPRAPVACGGGGYQWTAPAAVTRRLLERSVATTEAAHGDLVRPGSVVIAGFSQGAYAVAAVVHDLAAHAGSTLHVRGVVVQGAGVRFVAADVLRLGARVALMAGDLDAAAPAMRAEAAALSRAGVDARYVSLGKDEGHFIGVSTGALVAGVIDWARGD